MLTGFLLATTTTTSTSSTTSTTMPPAIVHLVGGTPDWLVVVLPIVGALGGIAVGAWFSNRATVAAAKRDEAQAKMSAEFAAGVELLVLADQILDPIWNDQQPRINSVELLSAWSRLEVSGSAKVRTAGNALMTAWNTLLQEYDEVGGNIVDLGAKTKGALFDAREELLTQLQKRHGLQDDSMA